MMPKLSEKRRVQHLRREGLSYNEILKKVRVAKSSVSAWCQNIELTIQQKERLDKKRRENLQRLAKLGSQAMALKRRDQVYRIKRVAKREIHCLAPYELKIVGTMLYWAEGNKTQGQGVEITNSDPELIKLMIKWAREVFSISPEKLRARLNIHIGQNDKEIKRYWSKVTGIPLKNFGKSYIKQEGTGHRKNILQNGVIRIKVGNEDQRYEVMAWIKALYQHQI